MLHRRHLHHGEKRGALVGKTKRGKGTKLMVLADGKGTPIGVSMALASPAEKKLLAPTLETVVAWGRGPGRPNSFRTEEPEGWKNLLNFSGEAERPLRREPR